MNTNEKETTGKNGLSLEQKVDLIIEKLDQLLKQQQKVVAAEGPKDPPPTPPNS